MLELITEVRDTSGALAATMLKKQLRASELRAAAPKIKGWSFDAESKDAKDWAAEHAAELVTGVSQTTREDLQAIISDALDQDELDSAQLADDIAAALGDDARAELIARTETIRASNEGQLEAWNQAVDEGFLSGDELQEWITTGDERLCPICEEMDGVQVGLDEKFDVDGEEMDGPPAHPNCRCTIGLVMPTNAMRDAWFDKSTGIDDHGRDPNAKNEKASRAIKSFKASTKAVQDKAREGEKVIAAMTGGTRTGDNKPVDHIVMVGNKQHGVEVKTFVHNSNDKITMHPSSRARKETWARKNRAELHTVVIDMRGRSPQVYYRRGVGSFRLHTMTKVSNAKHLRALMVAK